LDLDVSDDERDIWATLNCCGACANKCKKDEPKTTVEQTRPALILNLENTKNLKRLAKRLLNMDNAGARKNKSYFNESGADSVVPAEQPPNFL